MEVDDMIYISDDEAPAAEPTSPGVCHEDVYEDFVAFVGEVEKDLEEQILKDPTPAPMGTTMMADAAETDPTGEAATKACTMSGDATAEPTGEAVTGDAAEAEPVGEATADTGASKKDAPAVAVNLVTAPGELDVHNFQVGFWAEY